VAWDAAVRQLAARDCSELEVRRRLDGTDGALVDRVIERLRELRYLDDDRFARGLCERLARRGYGSARARAELAEHGVEHERIDAWVADMAEADAERAREQLARRFGGLPSGPRERARAARFLHNRGYDEELVLAITEQDW
jgi:regulatory protein